MLRPVVFRFFCTERFLRSLCQIYLNTTCHPNSKVMITKHLGVALFGFECPQLDHIFQENKMFVFCLAI